jgi:dihydrofolate reductase
VSSSRREPAPTSEHEPFASFINKTPKYIASTTLTEVTWPNSTLIEGGVADAVAQLKAEPGKDIGVHGSADLVRSLLNDDLIDELRLAVVPAIASGGKRLFDDDGEPHRMRLLNARQTPTGVMLLTYGPHRAT